jgi:hypothetical protein
MIETKWHKGVYPLYYRIRAAPQISLHLNALAQCFRGNCDQPPIAVQRHFVDFFRAFGTHSHPQKQWLNVASIEVDRYVVLNFTASILQTCDKFLTHFRCNPEGDVNKLSKIQIKARV